MFVSYVDGSGSTFQISRKGTGLELRNPENRKCIWSMTPRQLRDDGAVRYEGKRSRNILDWFFEGIGFVATCITKVNVELAKLSENNLELRVLRDGAVIGTGRFHRASYDSIEQRRVSSLSAQVWATANNSSQSQSRFPRRGVNITMRASANGDFQARDNWEFRVDYPNGSWGTCPQMICTISRNQDGSYSLGTYTLKALTSHRTLATVSFTVD